MHVHVTLRAWVCTEYWQLAAINPCLSLPVSTLFVLVNNNLRRWGQTHTLMHIHTHTRTHTRTHTHAHTHNTHTLTHTQTHTHTHTHYYIHKFVTLYSNIHGGAIFTISMVTYIPTLL